MSLQYWCYYFSMFLFLLGCLVGGYFEHSLDEEPYCNCESCNMRFDTQNSTGLLGVHRYQEYICLWTENRTASEVSGTYGHELAHFHVREDYKHYCVEYYPKTFDKYCEARKNV